MSKQRNVSKQSEIKKRGKGKGTVAAGALLLLLLGGGGIGIGLGGNGTGFVGQVFDSAKAQFDEIKDNLLQDKSDSQKEADAEQAEEEELLKQKVIPVIIREDKAIIGKKEFAEAESFKTYLEQINNDERSFRVEEDNALQATYEWVMNAMKELKVKVVSAE